METEAEVAEHYTRGALEQTIIAALKAAGKDVDRLNPEDLAPVDEFHIGARQATAAFAAQLTPQADMHLLDIGSGLGGPSRYFAGTFGCRVSGIDLTPEYVAVAQSLSRRTGFDQHIDYRVASALALPFADGTFDIAYIFHVGMNIADKAKLFSEARRVLKTGGLFGIYDVMRIGDGAATFPLPWATRAETSFLATPDDYKRGLSAAGFTILYERNRRDFAIEFYRRAREQLAKGSPPALGREIIMGENAQAKSGNLLKMMEAGLIAPTEIIARAT